jgi:hypothetical protein
MSRILCIMATALGLLQGSCAGPVTPSTPPTADIRFAAPKELSLDTQRGPWDAARLKAAEAVLAAPARSDLDRQRQALASAYIQWGDVLFKDLIPAALTDKTAPDDAIAPPAGSTSAWSSPPLWYWSERQQHGLDHILQQQREQYYRNRQTAPQFPRPPLCNSTQVGGQVYTHCY